MPKYMAFVKFTPEGFKATRASGAAKRRDVNASLIQSMGGRLEAYYYGLGEWDICTITDLPDDETAAATVLTVRAGGAVSSATIMKLMTCEQVDEAFAHDPGYRPPGE